MSQEPHARDRLNAEVVELMRQQTGMEHKDIDIMGKRFIVLPEVFYSPLLLHILEALAHSPRKIVAEELARRGLTTALDILEIGPGLERVMHVDPRVIRLGYAQETLSSRCP